jgi:hypothetical protein
MANTNVASGLRPVCMADGSPYNGATTLAHALSSYATALAIGDPVKWSGTADAAGVPGVTRSAAGETISGVVVGFQDATSMLAGIGAASTTRYLLLACGQDILFEVQEDGDGGAIAAADIGLNANLIAATASTYTKRSGYMLDTSTKNTTATLQVRIKRLAQRPDNEIGTNAKLLVTLNHTTETPGTASDGL